MSGRFKPAANTCVRPVTGGWWKSNPFYIWYTLRELTAVGVFLYGVVLVTGVVSLGMGEHAYNAWRGALNTWTSLLFHLILFVLVCYHSYTWFKVMPKTTPQIPVAPQTIVKTGVAVTAGLSLVIIAVLFRVVQ
jgi:fumarate reductase subunit C